MQRLFLPTNYLGCSWQMANDWRCRYPDPRRWDPHILELRARDLEPIFLPADDRQRKASVDPKQDPAADARLADKRCTVLQHSDVSGGVSRSDVHECGRHERK
jgi:hypothetical protein